MDSDWIANDLAGIKQDVAQLDLQIGRLTVDGETDQAVLVELQKQKTMMLQHKDKLLTIKLELATQQTVLLKRDAEVEVQRSGRRTLSIQALKQVKAAVFIIYSPSPSACGSSDSNASSPRITGSSGSNASSPRITGASGSNASSPRITQHVGIGVFVAPRHAVTAAHNLGKGTDKVVLGYLPATRKRLQLRVIHRNDALDYAILQCDDVCSHLQLYCGPIDNLEGEELAMCAFQTGIQEHLPEFSSRIGVMSARVVKLSREQHHVVYTSSTWPGDSGGAIVMYNGELVGLHIAGVNALKEKFEKLHTIEERLTAVESAAKSVAEGCVGLLVSVFADEVQKAVALAET